MWCVWLSSMGYVLLVYVGIFGSLSHEIVPCHVSQVMDIWEHCITVDVSSCVSRRCTTRRRRVVVQSLAHSVPTFRSEFTQSWLLEHSASEC